MKKSFNKKTLKYVPKFWTTLAFFILLIMVFLLFYGRKSEALRFNFITQHFPDYHQHISNFAITYILYAGVGYMWLLAGVQLKYITALGAAMAACNFIYELLFPVLNTKDIIDAYYGIGGTLLGFTFLLLVKKYGLKLNDDFSAPDQQTP